MILKRLPPAQKTFHASTSSNGSSLHTGVSEPRVWSGKPSRVQRDWTVRLEIDFSEPSEIPRLVGICEQLGWGWCQSSGAYGELDIPVPGSKGTAIDSATSTFHKERRRHGLPVSICAAYVLVPPVDRSFIFHVCRKPRTPTEIKFAPLISPLGYFDILGDIYASSEDDARKKLGHIAEELRYPIKDLNIRGSLGVRSPEASTSIPAKEQSVRARGDILQELLRPIFTIIAAVAAGIYLGAVWPVSWRQIIVIVLMVPLMAALWRTERLSPWLAVLICMCFGALGFYLGFNSHSKSINAFLVLSILFISGWGAVLLRRYTSPASAVAWLAPLILSLTPPVTSAYAYLSYSSYLQAFDLSTGDISVGWSGQILVALKPLAVALFTSSIVVGFFGFFKHRNSHFHIPVIFVLLPIVLYFTTAAGVAQQQGTAAGRSAIRATISRHQLPEFYAIESRPVCVRAIRRPLAFIGAEPPQDHAILLMGSSGDQLAFWDSSTGSIRLSRSDVSVTYVSHIRDRCTTSSR